MTNIINLETKNEFKKAAMEVQASAEMLQKQLSIWNRKFKKEKFLIESEVIIEVELYSIIKDYIESIINKSNLYISDINRNGIANQNLQLSINGKSELYKMLRIAQSMYGSLVTSLNWQSPAVKSSIGSRIGIEKEAVEADWNDYKRDRSSDTFFIEKIYQKYILPKSKTHSVFNIFNSGMAAFTGIIYFLICEKIIDTSIIASADIYVESKMLLKKIFNEKVEFIKSNNTESIIQIIKKVNPSVVFLEPISNTNTLQLLDIDAIIEAISLTYTKDIYFIIDITCSFGFNSKLISKKLPPNIKIIFHGSLLKAPQLGLERVSAGFIHAINLLDLEKKILDYRTLSGTNMQDIVCNCLPFTNIDFIQSRMKVIERNAICLAKKMSEIDTSNELISEVVYPGLEIHPDYNLSLKIGFSGFFFNIKFIKKFNSDKFFEIFTKEVISAAKKRNVDIIHGASFGFNMTSIYYSVGWDEPDNHYIRISPGTESILEVENIASILSDAFIEFKKKISINY